MQREELQQMESEQIAQKNLLTTWLANDHKEEEWKSENEHQMAQLKVGKQALEAYIPYKRHSWKKRRE